MELADLNSVLGEVIAAESGYEREIATDLQAGEIPPRIHPLSIKRALANMVVNAARYGNGWIKVSSGSEASSAWFRVEDDGPGIKPEQREHLFQPFVRGDSARSTSGTGLGLAIVQRIIDNHNGRRRLVPASGRAVNSRLAAGSGSTCVNADETEQRELSGRSRLPESRESARDKKSRALPGLFFMDTRLAFRTGSDQRGARWRIGVLLEVLYEQLRQLLGLLRHCSGEP